MSEMTASRNKITDKLVVEKKKEIGYLGFNQPEKHNAISFEMWEGICRAMDDFESDPRIRVIVVSGEGGRAFSAGADISQFEAKRGLADDIEVYNSVMALAHVKLTDIPKPTIARICGYCVGGGLAIALCCDLRIASEDAQFGIPAAKLGLGYSYQSLRPLVNCVGPIRAKEMLFSARRFSARESYDMGLINRVRTKAELAQSVDECAQAIAGNAPLSVKAFKQIVAEIGKDPNDRDLDLCQRLNDNCYASEDYKEGRRAFMEKRKPNFVGR